MSCFTEREVQLLKNSHQEFSQDSGAMQKVFVEYFRRYPHNQKFFPFRNVPVDELPENTDFQIQCVLVLAYTGACIGNLENFDVAKGIMTNLGRSHRKYRVPEESFWESAEVIVEGVSKFVDEETSIAHAKYWNFVVNTILDGMGR